MENLFTKKVPLYFETEESQLILGDSFKILTKMKPESVDMIFADPPYFLSNDGITCQGGMLWSSFFVTLRPNFCHRVYATP